MTIVGRDPEAAPVDAPNPESVAESASDVIVASGAVAAVGAAFSGLAPTGTTWWDPLLVGALAVAFVVAATRADQRVVFAAVAVATVFAGYTPWLAVGVAACGVLAVSVRHRTRSMQLRSVAASLAVLGLFHLSDIGFFGSSALLAAAAMLLVFVSAYRSSGGGSRARIQRVMRWGIAAVVVVLGVGGVQAVLARSTIEAGVDAARAAIDAAHSGDTDVLSREIERAQTSLAEANDRVSSVTLMPLKLVPVAAQHLRSGATATEQGLLVANEALRTAEDGNIDQLTLRQGQFDLDLLEELAPALERAASSLGTAIHAIERDRSPWLLPPVDSRLGSLLDEVIAVRSEADLAAQAARVMPRMLGSESERRYLLLFGSPGEAREFGGFVGGYAVLAIDDGRLDLLDAGSINDLVPIANLGSLDNPTSYPVEYVAADPATFPQNLTSTPSISTIARAVRDIFPELLGAPIDGVVYIDPYALAAMTELSGPVTVEGIGDQLSGDAIADFIFDGQYRLFDGRTERFEAIGELAKATAAAFATADLPGPEELGRLLGPVARGGRLQVVTYDDAENEFLTAVKLQRHFIAPPTIDSFALIHTNATASKLDLFVHRDVRYTVDVQGDQLNAVVDVELSSEIPADAPPLTYGFTDGTNEVLLSLYSPHELISLAVDGQPHEYVTQQEFGFFRYALFEVTLPANSTVELRFELAGTVPPGPYRLGVWQQPLVNDDRFEVVFSTPEAAPIVARQTLVEGWLFDPDLIRAAD